MNPITAYALASKLTRGSGIARTITKMLTGQNITAGFISDSVLYGSGASSRGTTDAASLICSGLASCFGVTVTQKNHAVIGRTTMASIYEGDFTAALNDRADIYFLAFGKNDLLTGAFTPGTGYPAADSARAVEWMIRKIRRTQPNSDIVWIAYNPNSGSSVGYNTHQEAYNKQIKRLCAYYGILYIDAYTAIYNTGDIAAYNSDGIHPNDAGHEKIANETLKPFVKKPLAILPNIIPEKSLLGTGKFALTPYKNVTSSTRAAGADGFRLSGTWTGSGPYVSSTAFSAVVATFKGTEVFFEVECGSAYTNAVVDIYVNGVRTYQNINLANFPSSKRKIPITGLPQGINCVRLNLVSGEVTVHGIYVTSAPCEFIDYDSPRITYTGTWSNVPSQDYYNGNGKYSASAGDQLTFKFVGTALNMFVFREPSDKSVVIRPTIDGVTLADIQTVNPESAQLFGAITIASGLEYGEHEVTIKFQSKTSGSTFYFGGVCVYDEERETRPRTQKGLAVVGEAVKFHASFASKPAVILSGNGVYPTSVASDGFTVSGTASQVALWEAEGGFAAY